jgi:SAM-dependent methyltransferase
VHRNDPEYVRLAEAERRHWHELHPHSLEALEPKYGLGPIDRHTNLRFTGDEKVSWEETISRYGCFRRGLMLGTTSLETEARILETNRSLHLTFVDLTDGPLARIQNVLGARFPGRVDTQVADLNFLDVPPATMDVIISSSTIHHVTNLEFLAYQINRALRSDGYFFLDDYVGEPRFNFSAGRRKLYQAIFDREEDRQKTGRRELVWSDSSDLSPFCALRSDEILPVFSEYLEERSRRTTDALVAPLSRSRPGPAPGATGSPFDSGDWIKQMSTLKFLTMLLRSRFPRLFGKMRSPQEFLSREFMDALFLVGDVLGDANLLQPTRAFCIYRKRAR